MGLTYKLMQFNLSHLSKPKHSELWEKLVWQLGIYYLILDKIYMDSYGFLNEIHQKLYLKLVSCNDTTQIYWSTSDQSYKASRVVPDWKIPHITTQES